MHLSPLMIPLFMFACAQLQSHGSPPEEIMGPLPPGFNMGSDGLPNLPDGCKFQ